MESKLKVLNAVRYIGGTFLFIGIISFLIGILVNGSTALIGIGIGAAIGAVFIFIMGVFFVITEEMTEKSFKGIAISPIKHKKGAPL
jgi:hypothetical protein